MPNMQALLGSLGFDPEKLQKDFHDFTQGTQNLIKGFDARLQIVEGKQDELLVLLKGMQVKPNGTENQ